MRELFLALVPIIGNVESGATGAGNGSRGGGCHYTVQHGTAPCDKITRTRSESIPQKRLKANGFPGYRLPVSLCHHPMVKPMSKSPEHVPELLVRATDPSASGAVDRFLSTLLRSLRRYPRLASRLEHSGLMELLLGLIGRVTVPRSADGPPDRRK